jgi:hypothetical protein
VNQPEDLNQSEESIEPGGSFAELEQYLTHAMLRVDPPDGFAERTLARIESSAPVRAKVVTMAPRARFWASGAIAAALLAAVFFSEQTYVRHQHEQAELAQQQFEAGIRITDNALERTREQLERAGVRIGN